MERASRASAVRSSLTSTPADAGRRMLAAMLVTRILRAALAVLAVPACHASLPEVVPASDAPDDALLAHPSVSVRLEPTPLGATLAQAQKLERARGLLEAALNDREFRRRVLTFRSARFGGGVGEGYLQARRSLPAEHAVRRVDSSREVLRAILDTNSSDGLIHIPVRVTSDGLSLESFAETPVGAADGVTSVFSSWLDRQSTSDALVAENLLHEHLHRLGFEHEHGRSLRRCASIPYAVGKFACAVSAGDAACLPSASSRC
jgi:hypothetical protein